MKSTTIDDDRPDPPKQPSPAYFNFAADLRAEYQKKGEKVSQGEIKERWDNLKKSEKEDYEADYKKQWDKYLK